MITGDLKSKIDRIWDAFWSGGISNPIEVIEQITYLLFIRRLDELQTLKENQARRLKAPIEDPTFLPGQDHLRWSRFKNDEAAVMFKVVADEVFPFLRTLGGEGSTYSDHMRDARFTIPTPGLLAKVVDLLDTIPLDDRDTKGDLYEYMLGKIATAGQNGQFRTPRHIIQLMVAMTDPKPGDAICDPASWHSRFLVAASEHLREQHPSVLTDAAQRQQFHHSMFHGYDFDNAMLRIGSMNMLLHGVEAPDIRYRDSLSEGAAEDAGRYSLILANPPFAGSLDYETTSKALLADVKTKKTELLFLALFLRLLKPGGRAAVIVPDGVLFGSSTAHKTLRKRLVETRNSTPSSSSPPAPSAPMPGSPPRSSSSPAPTPAAPTTSGSMTSRPTGGALTTNAHRCCRKTNSGVCRPLTCRCRPRHTRRTTCRTCWSDGVRAQANPSGGGPEPSRVSVSPRRTSSPRATTCRSIGTRRSSTKKSNTATPSTSSPTSRSWNSRYTRACKT